MNRKATAIVAVGVLAGSLAAGCARAARPTAELRSAEEIVAKNVEARGGLEAWCKVETMLWSGHVLSARAPMPSMQFEMEQKRPNKTRLEINALGDRSVRVFDGARGFKMRSASGRPEVEPYTPQEWKSARAGHGMDGPLIDYAKNAGSGALSVTLMGVDDVGGRKAYHLGVRLANGGQEDVWVDTETYLDVRYDRMVDGPAGAPRRVSTTYGDYRPVEGLKIPFLIATGGGQGVTPDKMQIEKVVLNAPLNDLRFESPAAPHPRNRSRQSPVPQAPSTMEPSTASAAAGEGRGFAPQ